MERADIAEMLSRVRTIRRYYTLVLMAAATLFAASIGSYYGQAAPILTIYLSK